MPEVPTPGVKEQSLPLHGATSISSLAPTASIDGCAGSTAMDGSFCLFCGNGVGGLPALATLSAAVTVVGAKSKAARSNFLILFLLDRQYNASMGLHWR